MNSDTIAQTHVKHGDKWFFVSTINRESSAEFDPERIFAETIVWTWNPETRKRGELIYTDGSYKDSIYVHQATVERCFYTGTPEKPE